MWLGGVTGIALGAQALGVVEELVAQLLGLDVPAYSKSFFREKKSTSPRRCEGGVTGVELGFEALRGVKKLVGQRFGVGVDVPADVSQRERTPYKVKSNG